MRVRTTSAASVAPWVWTGVLLVVALAAAVSGGGFVDRGLPVMVVVVRMTVLAGVIATRSPRNGISWLLYWIAADLLITSATSEWTAAPPTSPTFVDYGLLHVVNLAGVFFYMPVALLLLLFPTGHFLTRRWALLGWFAGVMPAVPLYALTAFAPDESIAFVLGFLAPLLLIPAAITVAILKYRLFEIDRLISRTLGYALVLTGLGAVYAVGSVWLPAHLVGERPPPFVAGSTLVVAALFNPVRRRALVWVDRRFYRSQYDAQRVIDRFGELLRDELDVGQLRSESMEAVVATMQPVSVSVWLPDRTAR